ncbi:uncharacterized protein METZ01_LOCUS115877 [marine metagenome]|uniref:Uncharacterized protein n=1 Tax=marine metagenome TaxID=408172 RepID=A0A381XFH2_9ZZZZ
MARSAKQSVGAESSNQILINPVAL